MHTGRHSGAYGKPSGLDTACIRGTLCACMDALVRTGSTKAQRDTSLTALSLESHHGETVLLLVEVEAKNREAKTFERECELVVKHALLETEGEPSQRLDGTLKELNGLLKGLMVSGTIDEAHMVIAILDRNHVLHVSHAGRAEAYLVRGGLASQITEYSTGKPAPAFVHIASGQLEKHDTLILSTQRLLRTLTPAQLSKTAEQHEPIDLLVKMLDTEGEQAALATVHVPSAGEALQERVAQKEVSYAPRRDRRGNRSSGGVMGMAMGAMSSVASILPSMDKMKSLGSKGGSAAARRGGSLLSKLPIGRWTGVVQDRFSTLLADLKHPKRKRRAHLLMLAIAVAVLVVIYVTVHLLTSGQRNKTNAELEALITEINTDVQTADNRRIIGDVDSANAILTRAEEKAKQVMDNESGLRREDALDLLDKIRAKKEEINNIIRPLSRPPMANIAAKSPDVSAQGIIGIGDGEFLVFDRQSVYRVLLNSVEDPVKVTDQDLIIDGDNFSRFQSQVFLTKGNSIVELTNGQATSMKTEDPTGWVSGRAMHTYLRFLYILSPDNKQIYKYERLANRYSAPVEYNVNGDLTGALDFAIDGDVYVLKEGGQILKLFRGETKPFVIRKAPADVMKDATKIFKVTGGNIYVLDPVHSRVIVISDGGSDGESAYLKQYIVEGEQVSELKDLYVDSDEGHIYVLDAKRVHAIDLAK